MHEQPQAPRMSAQEIEDAAAEQTEELLRRIATLDEEGAGVNALLFSGLTSSGHQ